MATHSSVLAWEIPQTEEDCRQRLQSVGSQESGHELATKPSKEKEIGLT